MEPHQVLFTCAPFLIQTRLQFKMEYTGKYPLTSSQEEARLMKGKGQRATLRGHMEGNWPGPASKARMENV